MSILRGSNGALTANEADVLRCLADGRSRSEIAALKFRSVHTINTHLRNILIKLDASNNVDAVVKGLRNGIIRLGAAVFMGVLFAQAMSEKAYARTNVVRVSVVRTVRRSKT